MLGWWSGQSQQSVKLSTYVSEGSNPSPSTVPLEASHSGQLQRFAKPRPFLGLEGSNPSASAKN